MKFFQKAQVAQALLLTHMGVFAGVVPVPGRTPANTSYTTDPADPSVSGVWVGLQEPTPIPEQPMPDLDFLPRNGKGVCGVSCFRDETTLASPLIEDCVQIAWNIRRGGNWKVSGTFNIPHQILEYGTCAFIVEGADFIMASFTMEAQDIIDLIRDSVLMFTWRGRVQAAGRMYCKTALADTRVRWTVHCRPGWRCEEYTPAYEGVNWRGRAGLPEDNCGANWW